MLRVRARASRLKRVRIYLDYRLLREASEELICEGSTLMVAVDASGRPKELPEILRKELGKS